MEGSTKKYKVRKRVVALYLFAYGSPAAVGFLGFAFGWWDRLASAVAG